MSNIQKIENVSHEEMLELRRKGVGGSDISVVCGENPWRTRYQLWLDKIGVGDHEKEDKLAFEVGTALEQTVADLACSRLSYMLKREVRCHKTNFTTIKDGFKIANPDRLFYDFGQDKTLLECKTTSPFGKDEWGTEYSPKIPRAYEHQINWYCGILGYDKAIIACLIGGSIDFVMRFWDYDHEMFLWQESEAEKFWNLVTNRIPPKATGDDLQLLRNIPKCDAVKSVEQSEVDRYMTVSQEISLLKEQLKPLEKELSDIKASMLQELEGCDGVSRDYEIKNTVVMRKEVDMKGLEKDYPNIFKRYVVSKPSYNKLTFKEI